MSCSSPAHYGEISSELDPVCKRMYYLKNKSTDTKITFVLKYTSIQKGQTWTDTFEQSVAPQNNVSLGCDGTADSVNYEIVSAYAKEN